MEIDEFLTDDEVLMNVDDWAVSYRVCLTESSDKSSSRVPSRAHVRKSS